MNKLAAVVSKPKLQQAIQPLHTADKSECSIKKIPERPKIGLNDLLDGMFCQSIGSTAIISNNIPVKPEVRAINIPMIHT